MSDALAYLDKRDDGVAYLVMNAPRKKNAMGVDMARELFSLMLTIEDDPEIRCVILKGEGGCFCAGGDMSGMQSSDAALATVETRRSQMLPFDRLVTAITHSDKAYIAQVDGYAMGGGFSLALACDMVFAGKSAKMSSMFTHVGLAPEMGAMLFLPQCMGMYQAKELWYSGRKVTGEEGYKLGFVSRVLDDDALEAGTLEMAQHVASLPFTTLNVMKRVVNTHIYSDLDAILAADTQDSPLCMMSKECLDYLQSNFRKK